MIKAQFEALPLESSNAPLRVLIGSPYAVVREGYRRILERSFRCKVCESVDADTSLAHAAATLPRLAIVDAALPPLGGVDLVHRLAALTDAPGIVLCALRCPGELAARGLNAGALSCIGYEADEETVVAACQAAARGTPYLTPEVMEQVALHRVQRGKGTSAALSPREFQVLRLIAEGKPHEEIADLLALSPRSVANYKAQLMRKLDVKTTAQLVHLAIRRGVIQSIV